MMRLLGQEELSVAELQEILEMGQSRISSHLGLLRRNGLVADRKDGKRTYYALQVDSSPRSELIRMAISSDSDEEFWESDQSALTRIVDHRRRESEKYFDEVAERLGKNYVPGRTWEAIGHFLFRCVLKKSKKERFQKKKIKIFSDYLLLQSLLKTYTYCPAI